MRRDRGKVTRGYALYIKNVTIHTENEEIVDGALLTENGKIKAIHKKDQVREDLASDVKIIDGQGLRAIPGFIDGHIHGAAGADVMDATPEALEAMAAVLPEEGTTSFLATTITQAPENIDKALENIATYQDKSGHAEIIGVHLEGPFLEKKKAGAQPLEYIVKPNIEQFDRWQELSGNKIKTITIAPEHDEDGSFIRHLYNQGINVSAGHTEIGFDGAVEAVSHGVRQVTHICNAMSGIHHRDIGLVGATFELEDLRAELIADGIHVDPKMLQLIYDNMGSERLILITDAMRAKCLQPGEYELGGQPVIVTEDRAVLKEGHSLAGSILKLNEGAQNMLALQGVSFAEVIEMASVNPAKQINVFDRKGSIAVEKDADILLVDDHLNIKHTICRGVLNT